MSGWFNEKIGPRKRTKSDINKFHTHLNHLSETIPKRSHKPNVLEMPRMTLQEFNMQLQKNRLPPYPITPALGQTPLEAIFSWIPDMIDKEDFENKDRLRLYVTIYDPDTALTGALYQSFYNQKQVMITDKSIPEHLQQIFPQLFKKRKKRAKSYSYSFEKNSGDLSISKLPKQSRKELKETIKHNILAKSGKMKSVDCIVIPVTPLGEFAISNSPSTIEFIDWYVDSTKFAKLI